MLLVSPPLFAVTARKKEIFCLSLYNFRRIFSREYVILSQTFVKKVIKNCFSAYLRSIYASIHKES